jgi:hypothetical protein
LRVVDRRMVLASSGYSIPLSKSCNQVQATVSASPEEKKTAVIDCHYYWNDISAILVKVHALLLLQGCNFGNMVLDSNASLNRFYRPGRHKAIASYSKAT